MTNRSGRAPTVALTLVLVLGACSHSSRARPAGRPPAANPSTTQTVTRVQRTADNVYAHAGVGQFSPAVASVPARVYVPNSESDTVDVIDPTTFQIVDHFAVGRLPQHVTPAWDLRTLYVDNDLGDSLTPVDPRTGRPGAPIPVTDPYNLYFTPDGTKAIVVAEKFHRLDFRDPHTWNLLKTIPISHPGVDHGDFSVDGKEMLLSCEFSGFVVRVDVERMAVTGELHVGGSPVDVKLAPDGSVYYVANQTRNGVSVVDASSMTERHFISTGKGAHGLYPSRDARSLYVSNRLAGSVSVIDFATQRLTATWSIGGSPDMGGVSADGTQLWLTGRYHREVYVIDTRTGQLLRRIPVGGGPHGLSVFPQPGRYSVGHTGVFR